MERGTEGGREREEERGRKREGGRERGREKKGERGTERGTERGRERVQGERRQGKERGGMDGGGGRELEYKIQGECTHTLVGIEQGLYLVHLWPSLLASAHAPLPLLAPFPAPACPNVTNNSICKQISTKCRYVYNVQYRHV